MIAEPKNILIVRTDRIGDVVLTLPLAGLIKKQYPNCRVSFLVRDYTKYIVSNHPFIDDIIVLKESDGKDNLIDNLDIIKQKNFDTCIVVRPMFIPSLIMFLSGIKNRIGTGYRWYSFLYNQKVYEHRKNAERHELEFNINLLEKLNIKNNVDESNVRYDLQVDEQALQNVIKVLLDEKIDLQKQIVIVHPGSGGSSIDLPINKFTELVKKLDDDDYQIILTGSKNEIELCDKIKSTSNTKNLSGRFNLTEIIALISKSSVFISNSTGPIHIAAALGIFTVGFYPKIISCSKERWSPYTNKKLVYEPNIDCKNCTREQCEKLNCMNSIDMTKVYNDIKNVLNKNQEK
ncbi:MAG: glycosyltransferase family 9 protein [Ignavibacteriaceae bacterium]|nr:glycosyltransferase family 9 protein [Ignavibacteriaceae bacterium]HRN27071.1 glycosyltransferase family 9 protein [Ignavibacteriaceae bacterium]HRQ54791.1 glycosyltransferase family 9 protein [Ignavibacteriaceae bacterium]